METGRSVEKGRFRYADILEHPHHQPVKRARMSLGERAAQFVPFAALTGYEEAVREEGRYTACRKELSEEEIQHLNECWRCLQYRLDRASRDGEPPCVDVELTYFVPDLYKSGGSYRTEEVAVVRLDLPTGEVRLRDGRRLAITDVIDLDGGEPETEHFAEEVFYTTEKTDYNTDSKWLNH